MEFPGPIHDALLVVDEICSDAFENQGEAFDLCGEGSEFIWCSVDGCEEVVGIVYDLDDAEDRGHDGNRVEHVAEDSREIEFEVCIRNSVEISRTMRYERSIEERKLGALYSSHLSPGRPQSAII